MSDRGYNSMTLEDAKKISVLIGSKGSLDSVNHGNRTKVEIFHKYGCHKPPSGPVKQLFKPDSHDSHKGSLFLILNVAVLTASLCEQLTLTPAYTVFSV